MVEVEPHRNMHGLCASHDTRTSTCLVPEVENDISTHQFLLLQKGKVAPSSFSSLGLNTFLGIPLLI